MQENDKATQFRSIANGLADLYERKNSDYGDSFDRSYEKYGSISALTRISDKFNRLESLMLGKEQKVVGEKVEDTLLDMASYCVMTVMEMRGSCSGESSVSVNGDEKTVREGIKK